MVGVGRTCIVTFPNLAYHESLRGILVEGRSRRTIGSLRDVILRHPQIPGYFYNHRFRGLLPRASQTGIKAHHMRLDTEAGVEVFADPNRDADLAILQ